MNMSLISRLVVCFAIAACLVACIDADAAPFPASQAEIEQTINAYCESSQAPSCDFEYATGRHFVFRRGEGCYMTAIYLGHGNPNDSISILIEQGQLTVSPTSCLDLIDHHS